MQVCVHIMCACHVFSTGAGAHRGPERASDAPELELQVSRLTGVLGTSTLNH